MKLSPVSQGWTSPKMKFTGRKNSPSLKDGLVWACFLFLKSSGAKSVSGVEVQLPELIEPGNFCFCADSHQLELGCPAWYPPGC